jgi:protein TonB
MTSRPTEASPSPLTISLAGTDSLSNAIVQGEAVIPARPDDAYRNRPPIYPRDAARRGQQGAVLVVIHVSPAGAAMGADIVESSGYPLLDKAALDAVLTWRFRPAASRDGTVAFDMPMRFVFALE